MMPNQTCQGVSALIGLGDVEAEHGSLDQAEPDHVDAQADAEGVGDRAERLAVDVGVAHVVERREVDAAHAGDVVAHVPVRRA